MARSDFKNWPGKLPSKRRVNRFAERLSGFRANSPLTFHEWGTRLALSLESSMGSFNIEVKFLASVWPASAKPWGPLATIETLDTIDMVETFKSLSFLT